MRNSSYSLIPILLKFYRQCDHTLKICMWFLAHLHEVHRAIVVTSVIPVYVYARVRVTLSVKVLYKSISLDHVDGSS